MGGICLARALTSLCGHSNYWPGKKELKTVLLLRKNSLVQNLSTCQCGMWGAQILEEKPELEVTLKCT